MTAQSVPSVTGGSFVLAMLDVLTSAIAILDSRGVIVAVNTAWHGDVGFHDGRLPVGVNYLDACASIIDPAARASLIGVSQVVARKRLSFRHDYPSHRPGALRWCSMRADALRDSPGFTLVSIEDITPRVMAEQQLAQERARYADAVERAGTGVEGTHYV